MLKAIIFDFDGVIANSIETKTIGFERLYEQYGKEIKEKVREHHLKNGGVSRFEKFKHYHQNLLKIKLDGDGIKKLANQYSKIVVDEVVDSTYVSGVIEYIKKMKPRARLFISTGTPTEEIKFIVKKKNIDRFFTGVYGSPGKKTEHIKKILIKYELKPSEVIFYGDSLSDLEAARSHDLNFILVKNQYNIFLQESYNGEKIDHFSGLL